MPERLPYPSREYALLSEVRRICGPVAEPGGRYELTIGDDAAIRSCLGGERLAITTDIAVESVHFTLAAMTFREIGFRTIAANVSDCAAMAALPEAALVQLVFARGDAALSAHVADLYKGITEACEEWRCKIIGGDLAGGDRWTIGITLIGSAPRSGRLLTRKGIRGGDTLWVSGFPGRSAAGLAALQKWGRDKVPASYERLVASHIRPLPQPGLGILLGELSEVHALMDCSDGLSKDCRTLCFENNLGLELSLDALAPPDDMVSLGNEIGISWREWALHGGEDYTLLFATSKEFDPSRPSLQQCADILPLGIFTDAPMELLVREGAVKRELPAGGWDHCARSFGNSIPCP